MKPYFIMVILVSIVTNQALADSQKPKKTIVAVKDSRWVSSVSLGPTWESAGQTQTFYLTPNIEKTYAAANTTSSLVDAEIFIGKQKTLSKIFQGQLGLAVAATNNANPSGNIWDDADSLFNNYNYNYQIQHTHFAVKGKLLADRGDSLIPWISASLGIGFNNAHGFESTALIFQAINMPNFSSNIKTSFTYTLGAGVQKILNPHWQAGMGYEFADWGQSQLNKASGQTLNSGLALSHLYTNGLLFNLTYLV